MRAALDELTGALPDPIEGETRRDALERAITAGSFASPATELTIARTLGTSLVAPDAWKLLLDIVTTPRAALFVSPSARLAKVPWGLVAMPGDDGHRLIELVDVLMAAPPNIVHSPREPAGWGTRRAKPPLLVLDPRVPGQRPDSPLGSVLGRPSADTALARHFGELMHARRRPSRRCGIRRLVPARRRGPRLADGPAGAGAEPPALRGPCDRGGRRCRPCRPGCPSLGRRPPAHRVGSDGAEAAGAPTRRSAGVRIRWRLSIRRSDGAGGRDDPRRCGVGDGHPVVTARPPPAIACSRRPAQTPIRWPRRSSPSTARMKPARPDVRSTAGSENRCVGGATAMRPRAPCIGPRWRLSPSTAPGDQRGDTQTATADSSPDR